MGFFIISCLFISLRMKIQPTCEAEIIGFYFRCNDRWRWKWTFKINYICEMDGEFSLTSFSFSDRLYHFIEKLQDRLKEIVRFHIHQIWQTVVVKFLCWKPEKNLNVMWIASCLPIPGSYIEWIFHHDTTGEVAL